MVGLRLIGVYMGLEVELVREIDWWVYLYSGFFISDQRVVRDYDFYNLKYCEYTVNLMCFEVDYL